MTHSPSDPTGPSGPTGLADLTARRLTAGYAAGEFSPVEATEAALARAEEAQGRLNAFTSIRADQALREAGEAEKRWRAGSPRGLLDGVPVTVKELFLMRGEPTLRGSRTVRPEAGTWEEDAPVVARMREHGAVFVARTTTPEFAWKGVTDSPLQGVTGNPYDPARTSGGSSGGSAVAVAVGAGPLSVGTDGGGSVRIPASFCGVFALKPTYGRVPMYPSSPFGTLAHAGPMTRDAADAALLMDVVSGSDPRDWSELGPLPEGFVDALAGGEGVRGLRIAYSPRLGWDVPVQPEVAAAVRAVADRLADLGAHVEEADPDVHDPRAAFETLWFSGAARVVQSLPAQALALLDPGLREICEQGARLSALDYLAAVDERMAVGRAMGRFHRAHDLLLLPTEPITAFEAGAEVPAGSGMRRWTQWTPFTYPFNMTQQPAASLPCGLDSAGLPIGAQLVGARHADALVLRAAHALYEAGAAGVPRP